MRQLILFLFIGFFFISAAQTNERDSLKALLLKEVTDSVKSKLLWDLGNSYLAFKPDSAITFYIQSLTISDTAKLDIETAGNLNGIGFAYYNLGNYPKALDLLFRSLRINEKINYLQGIHSNYTLIGRIYNTVGQYKNAKDYLYKAIELGKKLPKSNSFIPAPYRDLGSLYLKLREFDSARFYTQTCFDLSEKIDYDVSRGYALTQMGNIYEEMGQNNLAFEFYRSSIPYAERRQNQINLCLDYMGMARTFDKGGKADSALFYAMKAFILARTTGLIGSIQESSNFLSILYEKRYILDSALNYARVMQAANDSLFSQQKTNQFQTLSLDEILHQQEISEEKEKAKRERKHNLQYAAIAVGIIIVFILFFTLSSSVIVKSKFVEFFGVLALLSVFEFINLYIHPYLANWTNDAPLFMLLILMAIGALLVPLHHRLERWVRTTMIEKNKKIRLAAAHKTISDLEGKQETL